MRKSKLAIFLLVIFLTASIANAEVFEAYDKAGTDAANMVREALGGDKFDEQLLENYPGADVVWGGRIFELKNGGAIYLVYAEIQQFGEDPIYFFYEYEAVNRISPVSADNPHLMQKYGLK